MVTERIRTKAGPYADLIFPGCVIKMSDRSTTLQLVLIVPPSVQARLKLPPSALSDRDNHARVESWYELQSREASSLARSISPLRLSFFFLSWSGITMCFHENAGFPSRLEIRGWSQTEREKETDARLGTEVEKIRSYERFIIVRTSFVALVAVQILSNIVFLAGEIRKWKLGMSLRNTRLCIYRRWH